MRLAALVLACALIPLSSLFGQETAPERHDVVWDSPSADAGGSMPLGNGEISLNAWVEPDGALVFYIGRTDSWSDNGRLLKVGRLRVTTDPPLPVSRRFKQRLSLGEGAMVVRCGEGDEAVTLRLWVDAHHPMVHVTIEGQAERTATAVIDLWRTERTPYPECECSDLLEDRSKPNRLHEPIFVEPDTIIEGLEDRIGWYHFNEKSVGPKPMAEIQGLSDGFEGKDDPLLHRIFGGVVAAEHGHRIDDTRLLSPASQQHRFDLFVTTEHPSTPKQWLANIDRLAAEVGETSFEEQRMAHEMWWQEFWQRSWIHVTQVAGSDPVPRNAHTARIGIDQHDANRFVGEFGRLTISQHAATAEEIARLAGERAADSSTQLPSPLFRSARPLVKPIANSADWTFEGGLTLEAWLKPGDLPAGGGRIVDKTTPGSSDGLLFDTYPGRSLRLIVGSTILSAKDVLPKDEWVHVAATIDAASGALALYIDGRLEASSDGSELDDAATVSRAYALQRWVDACAGRGRYPIKFNGSIFTVPYEGKFGDADYRRWGPGYWWQNTRLPYLSMCASGDTEMMMRPLFRMYADELMPLHKHRTKLYTGHDGAFIPECIEFFGPIFTATYGWTPFSERGDDKLQESGWHKWEWVSGLELVWMMLDSYEHTLDREFARKTLIPTAREILTFFEQQYPTDENGKLVMTPSQALETWWDCTNPMPEVAGLRAVTSRLLSLPDDLGDDQERGFWRRVLAKTPVLPITEKDGEPMLAPAARFENKSNVENPELYAVFPFRLVSFEKENAPLGLRALEARLDRGAFGWRQDDLFMTHLGLAEAARANLVSRARNKDQGSRFPAFWGPNYDWVPDQDHGGVLMRTLQTMLMQTEGRTIHLLPAWPKQWEADFKLHAPYRTIVSGKVREGRVVELKVTPEERRKDVILHQS
ncbi:MAG: DUF5703 domain-containing protein [Planctomycetota bacterium]